MHIKIGYSPCPNDTFIFDALVHQKIDTMGYNFEVVHEDVEALNVMAMKEELLMTKLSYHAFGYLQSRYKLLNAGSALGFNAGPILIAKKGYQFNEIEGLKIAIPGEYTTANFLLKSALPFIQKTIPLLFSDIEKAILNDKIDCGLIIHESRFTYKEKGLKKVIDLGEWWESKTKLPIPLGGIVVSRKLPLKVQKDLDELVKKSLQFAFENPTESLGYVKNHAQELEPEVMKSHIDLYVNEFSLNLGDLGKKSVLYFLKLGTEKGLFEKCDLDIFV